MSHHVYILNCADSKPYVGCTQDFKERLHRHKNGHVPATSDRLPVELVINISFKDKYKAFDFEKYLKTGSGRAFMNRHFL